MNNYNEWLKELANERTNKIEWMIALFGYIWIFFGLLPFSTSQILYVRVCRSVVVVIVPSIFHSPFVLIQNLQKISQTFAILSSCAAKNCQELCSPPPFWSLKCKRPVFTRNPQCDLLWTTVFVVHSLATITITIPGRLIAEKRVRINDSVEEN